MKLCLIMILCSAALAQSVPDAPQPQRVTDRKFAVSMMIDSGVSLADATISSRAMRKSSCVESDPLYGGLHPSSARYFGQMIGTTAALGAISYFAKKQGWFWWSWPLVIDASQHIGGVVATAANCRTLK